MTIDASQSVSNYWLNITFGGAGRCGSSNNPYPAAIVHYDGASDDLPTYAGTVPTDHQCLDLINLTPVVSRTVPTTGLDPSTGNTLDVALNTSHKWTVSGSSQVVDWSQPVVQHVIEDNTTWPGITGQNVWQVDEADEVSHK